MILSMIFIGVLVALEAWPVYTLFMADIQNRSLSWVQWVGVCGAFSGIALLIGTATLLPMKLGLRNLQEMDF
jgi:ABC-2 type transport system permease protein